MARPTRSPKPARARIPAPMSPQADDAPLSPVDLYEVASLTLTEAHVLTQYLTDRLDDLYGILGAADGSSEAHALHLLARHVADIQKRLRGELDALHPHLVVAWRASA